MPWHLHMYDFSLLEVNRYVFNLVHTCVLITYYYRDITKIRGLTRETLIALTTNIESREQKRCSNMTRSLIQEHPRASTTDDVECFFSVIRDSVGKHFTHKDVQFVWRKVCIEFSKRLSPDLPLLSYVKS